MGMPKIEIRTQMFRGDWDQVWSQMRLLWIMEGLCRLNQTHIRQFTDFKERGLVERGRHLQMPPEQRSEPVETYLAQQPPWPEWVKDAQLHRSADFFDENGLLIGTALFCASLPEAYAGARRTCPCHPRDRALR